MTLVTFRSAALTHVGRVRELNEDAFVQRDEVALWAVADGMGGHERGEFASAAIAEALSAATIASDGPNGLRDVEHALSGANRRIWDEAKGSGQIMGTTVVALRLFETSFQVVWCGDSRAYLLRGADFYQLTTDHTWLQQLLDAGEVTDEDASGFSDRSALARAVGVEAEVVYDVVEDAFEESDIFLLCSDGLSGVVEEDRIASILRQHSPVEAARRLISDTLDRGAPDNVTVVIVCLRPSTVARALPGSPSGSSRSSKPSYEAPASPSDGGT